MLASQRRVATLFAVSSEKCEPDVGVGQISRAAQREAVPRRADNEIEGRVRLELPNDECRIGECEPCRIRFIEK